MVYDEFIALDRGLLRHPARALPRRHLKAAPGVDASAIHGRLGAQAALLQSPILPAARSRYTSNKTFQNFPVDKPHTCVSWFDLVDLCPIESVPGLQFRFEIGDALFQRSNRSFHFGGGVPRRNVFGAIPIEGDDLDKK